MINSIALFIGYFAMTSAGVLAAGWFAYQVANYFWRRMMAIDMFQSVYAEYCKKQREIAEMLDDEKNPIVDENGNPE